MKGIDQINREIDDKVNDLIMKGVNPKILLVGDLAYYTLKTNLKHLTEKFHNTGEFLVEHKNLRVIKKPSFEAGGAGVHDPEVSESVEVFGE